MNISSLEIIVKSNFCLWTNLYLPFEDMWFFALFGPIFVITDENLAQKSIFATQTLFSIDSAWIFKEKNIFLELNCDLGNLAQLGPNLALFGPNLAPIWPGLVVYGVFLTYWHRPTLVWGQKNFQKFYRKSGWFFSVIRC